MRHIISIWFPPTSTSAAALPQHSQISVAFVPACCSLWHLCRAKSDRSSWVKVYMGMILSKSPIWGILIIDEDYSEPFFLEDDLTLESIMNCHLVWLHASSSAWWESLNVSLERVHAWVRSHRDSQNLITSSSFNLSDGVWAVPQQCVIGQDVLKFSCLWFSFQISH